MGDFTPTRILIALTLVLAVAAPAQAIHEDDGFSWDNGCAVTPGGWGSPPRGNNPGALLHAHFDEVFGDALVVDGYTFESAQEVTDTLPANGDPLLSHAVALAINLAFGAEGLLDGTLEGIEVEGGPYDGKTAEEMLEIAATALADGDRSTPKYSRLIRALDGLNNEAYGCNAEEPGPCTPGTPGCPLPPPACPGMPMDLVVRWYNATGEDGTTTFTPPLQTADDLGHLEQGDHLVVTFTIVEGCEEMQLSLVSYQALAPTFTLPQTLYDFDTGFFETGTHTLEVMVPGCYYQVDFVRGDIIVNLSEEDLYGDRKIDWENGGTTACETPPTPPVEPECPADVQAVAQPDGGIRLTWASVAVADGYNVYRAEGDGELVLLASVEAEEYLDTATEAGVTYTYMVTATHADEESEGCATVAATAVPFFGGWAMTAIVGVAALAGFVLLRRRG